MAWFPWSGGRCSVEEEVQQEEKLHCIHERLVRLVLPTVPWLSLAAVSVCLVCAQSCRKEYSGTWGVC